MILSPKQKEYKNAGNHRYKFKIGARRCGKTYLDILDTIPSEIINLADKEGLNVILGVSKGTIERNVLSPMREIYGKSMVGFINSNNVARLFNQEVYCLGAEKENQVNKLQGTSIKFLYGDEIAKWNKKVFKMIQASLDKPYSRMHGALNPEHKNHWFKKEFLDKIEKNKIDCYIQKYTIFDNPFLEEDVRQNIIKDMGIGTVYYNRYILGEWCDAEGTIFKQIANDNQRYLTENKLNGFCIIGIDWGGNKSYHSITATIISNNFDKIQVIKSERLLATGTGTEELFKWIIYNIKEIASYNIIKGIYCDSAEQVLNNSLKKELKNNNLIYTVYNSIKTPIKERIELLNIMLNTDRISFIKNRNDELIEALQTAVYDEKDEDCWKDDGETSDIDSLDSFCYSWTGFYKKLARS